MRRAVASAVIAAAIGAAVPAGAQPGPGTRVSINGGAQTATTPLSESITLPRNQEDAVIEASAAKAAMPFFDGGVTVRVAGNVGVQAAYSFVSGSNTVDVHAEIPHPFFFNQKRPVDGQTSNVLHSESAFHLDLSYVVVSDRIDLGLFGGASFMKVRQDLVTDVVYDETYPYDTATFTSATLGRAEASKVGYNLGADVTWKAGRRWGVGGLLRFTRARVPFSVGTTDAGTTDVGGLQAGGGVRFFF